MLVGDAREDQTNVVRAPGLHRRVEEELVEHVLLRVAAAEAMHVSEHRPHQFDHTRILTAPMRQHGLADGQCDIADDRSNGFAAAAERAHGLEHALRRIVAAGRGQSHQPMRQRERRAAIADPIFGLVGKLDPAIADGHLVPLQPKQHRGGILNVDMEVGLRLRQWRLQVAKTAIVEVENRVELAPLQMEQRAVPPQMMQEVIAAGPMPLQLAEPGNAVVVSILHLHDMGNRVRGPQIGGIELDRRAAGRLGNHVVTAFLVGKAAAGQDRAPAGQIAIPLRNDALDRCKHVPRPPQPEIFQVREPQREHVGRMVGEDGFPNREGAVEVAGNPGFQSVHMGLLACRRLGHQRPCGPRRLGGRRHACLLVEQHGEIALEAMR